MIFFNQNQAQDKLFLKLQTKLNFAFWIVSDIDHYFENSAENINAYQHKQLLKQYQASINIFDSVDIKSAELGFDHKAALYALKGYVKHCINYCNFNTNKIQIDSESEEINLLEILEAEKKFHETYLKYLHPDEMESFIINSYSFFGKGVESIMQLTSEIEFQNDSRIETLSEEILKDLILARNSLNAALTNPNALEFMLDELTIICNGVLSKEDVGKFSELNFDYIKLWREYVVAHERYCKNLLNENSQEENILELLNFECNNYLGLINILAIKIHLFILNKMQINIPELEIFSQRIIKSPIDYIQKRHL
jgi:hypothetical protein